MLLEYKMFLESDSTALRHDGCGVITKYRTRNNHMKTLDSQPSDINLTYERSEICKRHAQVVYFFAYPKRVFLIILS